MSICALDHIAWLSGNDAWLRELLQRCPVARRVASDTDASSAAMSLIVLIPYIIACIMGLKLLAE
jgi:hypothetical protein